MEGVQSEVNRIPGREQVKLPTFFQAWFSTYVINWRKYLESKDDLSTSISAPDKKRCHRRRAVDDFYEEVICGFICSFALCEGERPTVNKLHTRSTNDAAFYRSRLRRILRKSVLTWF